uniref:Uncharacterized protein n=1 Tax=Oryza nivara TaxID=4536 RepID=A0A0E0H4I5_ORYNI
MHACMAAAAALPRSATAAADHAVPEPRRVVPAWAASSATGLLLLAVIKLMAAVYAGAAAACASTASARADRRLQVLEREQQPARALRHALQPRAGAEPRGGWPAHRAVRVQREPEQALGRLWRRRRRAELTEREPRRGVLRWHLHRHLQWHVAAGASEQLHRGERAAAPAVGPHWATGVAHAAALQARERRELPRRLQPAVVRERQVQVLRALVDQLRVLGRPAARAGHGHGHGRARDDGIRRGGGRGRRRCRRRRRALVLARAAADGDVAERAALRPVTPARLAEVARLLEAVVVVVAELGVRRVAPRAVERLLLLRPRPPLRATRPRATCHRRRAAAAATPQCAPSHRRRRRRRRIRIRAGGRVRCHQHLLHGLHQP